MAFLTRDKPAWVKYENLSNSELRTRLGTFISTTIIILSIVFLVISAWSFHNSGNSNNVHLIYLNPRQSLLHEVSDKFLSFGLDSSLLRNMGNLPILNDKFNKLARHLAPAFVRVGGTSADCLYFNKTAESANKKVFSPVDGQDISNFTITDVDFANLHTFSTTAQLRMIFDLNVLIRNADNTWNTDNAWEIISFAKKQNMDLDWQLGNEPNSFHHVFNVIIPPEQLAKDYYELRQLLNKANFSESLLVGPEVNHIGDANQRGELYAKTFVENDKNSVNFITWHQYYLNGREAQVNDFINPNTFDQLPSQIQSIQSVFESSHKDTPLWLSETSSAYGSGAPNLSDRFVAGFLWLDKLGYSARAGLNVVTRQSFYGGHYALVGPDLRPNPDWWVSVLYKQFVSKKVLKLTILDDSTRVRLYAHCTPSKTLINRVPAFTIYGININRFPVSIILQPPPDKSASIFFYALTSDSLQSRNIQLNGRILELQPDGELPAFRPIILKPTDVIILPPYSIVFMVIHGVEVPACTA